MLSTLTHLLVPKSFLLSLISCFTRGIDACVIAASAPNIEVNDMALPHDEEIQTELLSLLADAPHGRMHCQDIYEELARRFRCLTEDEKTEPYRNSVSHWANRVQFARLHLVDRGWLLHASINERAVWAISDNGRTAILELDQLAKSALAELDAL